MKLMKTNYFQNVKAGVLKKCYVRPLPHTTPEKFENRALFLRLSLPSTLVHYENGTFRKRSSNRRNLKTPTFRFLVDGKHFAGKTELFKNESDSIIMWIFLNRKSKMTRDCCCVLKILRRSASGRKTFDAFSAEWNLRFQISPAQLCGRSPNLNRNTSCPMGKWKGSRSRGLNSATYRVYEWPLTLQDAFLAKILFGHVLFQSLDSSTKFKIA